LGALVAGGLSNVQVAEALRLSENTLKFHVQHLFARLGVKNRTEAALRYAARRGPCGGREQPGRGETGAAA
jgi:non-specific serine/threonine protein kinase